MGWLFALLYYPIANCIWRLMAKLPPVWVLLVSQSICYKKMAVLYLRLHAPNRDFEGIFPVQLPTFGGFHSIELPKCTSRPSFCPVAARFASVWVVLLQLQPKMNTKRVKKGSKLTFSKNDPGLIGVPKLVFFACFEAYLSQFGTPCAQIELFWHQKHLQSGPKERFPKHAL